MQPARPADALRRLELRRAPGGTVVQQPAPSVGGPINYQVFLEELQRDGYDGYLVSEYCLPCIRDHRIAGIAEIDQANVQA